MFYVSIIELKSSDSINTKYVASSRDGTVKLWNCGTSSTISTMGDYQFPVNKMILAKLPSYYEPATVESLGNHLNINTKYVC